MCMSVPVYGCRFVCMLVSVDADVVEDACVNECWYV